MKDSTMHVEDTYLYINDIYPPTAGEKKKVEGRRKEEEKLIFMH